ncbi:MAG: DUF58 domain-containing protein [archaeon]
MPLKSFNANLSPGIKELTMKIRKDLLTTAMAGELASKLKGRGIEFEDYRDYSTEDDAARIDWRASQRSQKLLVREYKLDVNFNVFFMIDVSESMLMSSTKKLKCEYAAEVVNTLFYGLVSSGNSVGFCLFADGLKKLVKSKLGKKQYHLFIKEVADPKNYGGNKNMGKAIHQTLSVLDRKTMIFLVSDFIGQAGPLAEYLKIIAQVHETIGIMISDPLDLRLPSSTGQILIQDPYSDETIYADVHDYGNLYQQYSMKQTELISTTFQKNRSKFLQLTTDQGFYNPMLKFFRKMGATWR